mgnify:CR=1 FL=1
MVSSPIETGLINPSAARAGVKIAENFKNFMSEYKKRLRESGLSGSMPRETAKMTGGSAGAGAVGG